MPLRCAYQLDVWRVADLLNAAKSTYVRLVNVYSATGATDMRKALEALRVLVRDKMGKNPLSGHLFLLANKMPPNVLNSGKRACIYKLLRCIGLASSN